MKPIKTIVLMGGGPLLWKYAKYISDSNLSNVFLLSSERHLKEVVLGEKTLRELVITAKISYAELKTLNASELNNLIFAPETAVVFSFGAAWIIRQEVIDLFEGRIYNLHGTRLPQDRGGASVSWQIMRGNKYGFALIHRIDAGIDTGDIVSYKEFIYEHCNTPADYQYQYTKKAFLLLKQFTEQILAGEEIQALSQPAYFSTYWPRLNTERQGWIDWSWSGTDILRFVCAFDSPYMGAHTLLDDRIVYIKSCDFDVGDGGFHPFQAGLIYRITEQYVAVCVTTGSLLIQTVFDEQHNEISFDKLKLGSRLFTPLSLLEQAKRLRIQYTSSGLREPVE